MADAIDRVDQSISIVGRVALTAGETTLFASQPILALPLVRQIVEYILALYAESVIRELQKTSNAVIIFVSEEANAKAASAASDQLKVVQNDPKATPADKKKASDDFKAAYERLIHFRIDGPIA